MAESSRTPIVVGLDGSTASRGALIWAAELGRDLSAELILVSAFEGVPSVVGRPRTQASGQQDDSGGQSKADLKQALEGEWSAPARNVGVALRTVMSTANPVAALTEVADQHDARMIVVGNRGLGRRARIILGSVSSQLVRASHRPVVVVREVVDLPTAPAIEEDELMLRQRFTAWWESAVIPQSYMDVAIRAYRAGYYQARSDSQEDRLLRISG